MYVPTFKVVKLKFTIALVVSQFKDFLKPWISFETLKKSLYTNISKNISTNNSR